MNTIISRQLLLFVILAIGVSVAPVPAADIPKLNWTERSDWLNVKTDVTPAAHGDGITDDTAAIQKAFDTLSDDYSSPNGVQSRVVYFPPGRYRITKTLVIRYSTGAYVVGHGRDTVLQWDGAKDGVMYWSDGAQYIRYEGLTFDGKGIAAIGVQHHSTSYYETCLRYQHCAFINFTEHGLVVGKGLDGQQAVNQSAEFWFNNCLFRNCANGVSFLQFNDYDNTFDACMFIDCCVGVNSINGNFYLHTSHFLRSKDVDVRQASASHSSAIRLCTSVGSRRFFDTGSGMHQSITIQDCHVKGWTGKDGAVVMGQRGPTTVFDCVFSYPPTNSPPIRLVNPPATQQVLLLSNNTSVGTNALFDKGPNSRIIEIPVGKRHPTLRSAEQTFLQDTAIVPGKVFDAKRDFGAKGDGQADDTAALQKCINAAKTRGKGAIAYLPNGVYCISYTLIVEGSNYTIGSTGFNSHLRWTGGNDGIMLTVKDPRDVTIEHLSLYQAPTSVTQVRQTSKGGKSSIYYDGLYVGICGPNGVGMELIDLPKNATVRMGQIVGPLRVIDCGRANILGRIHYYELIVSGDKHPKTGFTGFLFHNDAVHGYALEVKDNQDITIADFYSESNQQYLLAEGGLRKGTGHITLGAKKISTLKQEVITIHDYEGRIFIGGGDAWWQSDASKPLAITHTGNRPLDLLMVGNGYWGNEPTYVFGAGLRFVNLGNILIENKYPEYGEKTIVNQPAPITNKALCIVAEALDDFRELAEQYLRLR